MAPDGVAIRTTCVNFGSMDAERNLDERIGLGPLRSHLRRPLCSMTPLRSPAASFR
jgi:hypothetical protein